MKPSLVIGSFCTKRGVSIPELMLVVAIVGIALVAAITIFMNQTKGTRHINDTAIFAEIRQTLMSATNNVATCTNAIVPPGGPQLASGSIRMNVPPFNIQVGATLANAWIVNASVLTNIPPANAPAFATALRLTLTKKNTQTNTGSTQKELLLPLKIVTNNQNRITSCSNSAGSGMTPQQLCIAFGAGWTWSALPAPGRCVPPSAGNACANFGPGWQMNWSDCIPPPGTICTTNFGPGWTWAGGVCLPPSSPNTLCSSLGGTWNSGGNFCTVGGGGGGGAPKKCTANGQLYSPGYLMNIPGNTCKTCASASGCGFANPGCGPLPQGTRFQYRQVCQGNSGGWVQSCGGC